MHGLAELAALHCCQKPLNSKPTHKDQASAFTEGTTLCSKYLRCSQALSDYEHVRGGLAADQGILIDSMGNLPGEPERCRSNSGLLSDALNAQQDNLGGNNGYASLNRGDASLSLLPAARLFLQFGPNLMPIMLAC